MKKVKAVIAYVLSAKGWQQIHTLLTTALAIYIALHRAGV